MIDVFAFALSIDVDGDHYQHVVAGPDPAVAASTAQHRLQERHGAVARIVRMGLLAEMLGEPHTAPRRPTALASAVQAGTSPGEAQEPSSRRTGTRRDQLVELLHERGGPVHLDDVAEVLGFKRSNADTLASRLAKAGVVRRVGKLTSLIALPDWRSPDVAQPAPVAASSPAPRKPSSPRRESGATRLQQVLGLLHTRARDNCTWWRSPRRWASPGRTSTRWSARRRGQGW